MPVVSLTDIAIRHLKPVPGKQVTYTDRSLKGFGVRVSERGVMTYVLVVGANRKRIKIGNVGVLKLSDARATARSKLAEKQLGINQHTTAPTVTDLAGDLISVLAVDGETLTVGGRRGIRSFVDDPALRCVGRVGGSKCEIIFQRLHGSSELAA